MQPVNPLVEVIRRAARRGRLRRAARALKTKTPQSRLLWTADAINGADKSTHEEQTHDKSTPHV